MQTAARSRPIAFVLAAGVLLIGCRTAPPALHDAAYLQWLEERSMLAQSRAEAAELAGSGDQWRHAFTDPQPRELVREHSVWLLHYPGSVIPEPGKSVIATWGDPQLWDDLRTIGIDLLHTCPTRRAGGVEGRDYTPTIDGWFDPISLEVDPLLGTDDEYRQMVRTAGERGGAIAGDLVPVHTGMGPDFRLAERAYGEYPGLYSLVEIDRKDWSLLPAVEDPWSSALVPREAALQLRELGYIPGLVTSADAHPEAKSWSGWSATGEIVGADGKARRWLYLHVFKPAQPALDWLDPSYGARRILAGAAIHSLRDLGDRVVRIDAGPFLGLEPQPGPIASNFMNPLSVLGTRDLAFMVRKVGGWSFQELNVPLSQYGTFAEHGPDLGYDFFTRAQMLTPLLGGDARPLRLAHRQLLEAGVEQGALIHDLQNHDEITFSLIDLGAREHEQLRLDGETITAARLRQRLLEEMRAKAGAPYNPLYRPERDGIATTFAGFIAAALGIRDPWAATPEEVEQIERAHLLLAHANAMQPGVFALSSWDLVGALPLPLQTVADRTVGGDYRWVNRGAVDLLGANPAATTSAFGLPRAKALYGSLPEQLRSPESFASRLQRMLAARKRYRIAEAEVIAVPEVADRAVAVLVMKTVQGGLAITALNYGRGPASIALSVPQKGRAHDIVRDEDVGAVSASGKLHLQIEPLAATTVVIE